MEAGIVLAEECQFVRSAEVFEGQDAEVFAVFGFPFALGGDDSRNGDFPVFEGFQPVVEFFQGGAKELHFQLVWVQGMGRQVNANQVLFFFGLFVVVPGLAIRDGRFDHVKAFQVAEQTCLHTHGVLLFILPVID